MIETIMLLSVGVCLYSSFIIYYYNESKNIIDQEQINVKETYKYNVYTNSSDEESEELNKSIINNENESQDSDYDII